MFKNYSCLYVVTYENWFADYYGETPFYKQFETEKKLLEIHSNEICLGDDILENLELKLMSPKIYDLVFRRILMANTLDGLEQFEKKIGHKFP